MDEYQGMHPAIRGLKVVCRCNNIKYRTIEKAIDEGARTVEAVARCTRATTGHCGGSCTPKIQQMIALAQDEDLVDSVSGEELPDPGAWWIRREEGT